MSKRVLFISPFLFPEGDAGATRSLMLARALQLSGCDVELCGMGDELVFDGFKCRTLNRNRNNKLLNWLAWRLVGQRAASFVSKNAREFDAVVASFLPSRSIEAMKAICSDRGLILAVDSTEWFEPEQFPKGALDRGYLDHMRLLTRVVDSSVRVIAISSYLQGHFKKIGCSVLRVPAVLDVKELAPTGFEVVPGAKVRLMYAGSPGKKDALDIILSALNILSDGERRKITLDLYGVTESQAHELMPNGLPLPECVRAHGRVTRAEVVEALHNSDVTVLMRDPSKSFARAGMPTKVTESLSSGVPVISNLTSDLGEFLVDASNAFVVADYSADACADAIRRAIATSWDDRARMRQDALNTARHMLDYRVYAASLKEFLFDGEGNTECA